MKKTEKTVYVIGAGASVDFGFPAGEGLKDLISSFFEKKDGSFKSSLMQAYYSSLIATMQQSKANEYFKKADVIRGAMPISISIDNFLDAHKDDESIKYLGKLAILTQILYAENKSKIWVHPNKRGAYDAIQAKCWHMNLFQSLSEGCDFEKFKQRIKSVSFIVFNYDRALEHYLWLATQIYYQVKPAVAAEAINESNFYHPYGQCGWLSWQKNGEKSNPVDYGVPELGFKDYEKHIGEIFTFAESPSREDSVAQQQSHFAILNASRVIVLGFAFHPLNMKWLKPDHEMLENNCKLQQCAEKRRFMLARWVYLIMIYH